MKFLKVVTFFVITLSLSDNIQCARILGIFYYPGKSHQMSAVTLMKILANRGHEITVVSPIGEENTPENYRQVVLKEVNEMIPDQIKNYFKLKLHPYIINYVVTTMMIPLINSTLSHPKLHDLITTEKFDLVIMEQLFSDGLAYIAHLLDVPVVYFSAFTDSLVSNPCIGNPAWPSYAPDIYSSYTSEMTFFQRLDNTVIFVINELIRNLVTLPTQNKMVQMHFPGAPHITEYYHRASIVLLNGDLSVNEPLPKVPGAIDIGGFHIRPSKPLPTDLQDILNTAAQGVIYFSMGGNIKSVDIPIEKRTMLLNVFSKLKQTVLWKWEADHLPNKSDNIVIRKWLPQNDVLAHKNVKLFITHAGLHSLLETIYHGVPCLNIPVFVDQLFNAKKTVVGGFGKTIHFDDISEENLLLAIDELLQNPNYAENAKKRSMIMRDKPMSPADTIAYWVEYAIRHKGAEHLKVASLKLYWFQYLLLDVVAFLVLCVLVLILLMKYSLKIIVGLLRENRKKSGSK
ncbi:hypothetical protein WA026_014406 [Henosepilachna vigintioctopunctata]|uniref:UDP-glucuronosyltransferase n=1 Tax=Henosepilachna vigintioctopunctata TaxID=420089 RepID=A0AAW1UJQ0_9CUCU